MPHPRCIIVVLTALGRGQTGLVWAADAMEMMLVSFIMPELKKAPNAWIKTRLLIDLVVSVPA